MKKQSVNVRPQYMKIMVSPNVNEEAIKNSRLKMKIAQEPSKAIQHSRTKVSEESSYAIKI